MRISTTFPQCTGQWTKCIGCACSQDKNGIQNCFGLASRVNTSTTASRANEAKAIFHKLLVTLLWENWLLLNRTILLGGIVCVHSFSLLCSLTSGCAYTVDEFWRKPEQSEGIMETRSDRFHFLFYDSVGSLYEHLFKLNQTDSYSWYTKQWKRARAKSRHGICQKFYTPRFSG